jgi:hypothetical protein
VIIKSRFKILTRQMVCVTDFLKDPTCTPNCVRISPRLVFTVNVRNPTKSARHEPVGKFE